MHIRKTKKGALLIVELLDKKIIERVRLIDHEKLGRCSVYQRSPVQLYVLLHNTGDVILVEFSKSTVNVLDDIKDLMY